MFVWCHRDFISPLILKMEYGIANVLEQYETKYKARQLLGDISDRMPQGKGAKGVNKHSGPQGGLFGGF